jgi:hypothetical protein
MINLVKTCSLLEFESEFELVLACGQSLSGLNIYSESFGSSRFQEKKRYNYDPIYFSQVTEFRPKSFLSVARTRTLVMQNSPPLHVLVNESELRVSRLTPGDPHSPPRT